MQRAAQRIGIYGTGGVGKTSLASLVRYVGKRPILLDADDNSRHIDIERYGTTEGLIDWQSLRGLLADDSAFAPYDVIILDSITRCEEWCSSYVVETVPVGNKEKSYGKAERIEDFGWGKGFTHIFEAMKQLLADLDRHVRAGRDVIVIAHNCKASVPNPMGEDFIRYEPRLQGGKAGGSDFRSFWKEWLNHLFFIEYDVAAKDGRAVGYGSRTIYPQERPHYIAKSVSIRDPIVYPEGSYELWVKLFQ